MKFKDLTDNVFETSFVIIMITAAAAATYKLWLWALS